MRDKKNHVEDSKKIRVLLSGALPPPESGIGTYYQSLLNSSLSEKVELQFVETSAHRDKIAIIGRANIENISLAIRDCVRYSRALIAFRPQIAHVATAFRLSFVKHAYCVWVARLMGARVLLFPHCGLPAFYTGCPGWWQWFVRLVFRWTSGITVLSKEWLDLCSCYPREKIHYLPIAIDLSLYRGIAENRFAEPPGNEKCKVLYLGFVGQAKGTFDLIRAAAILKSRGAAMTFDLVGSEIAPGAMAELQAAIDQEDVGDIVRLCGPAYGQDKLEHLRGADIFAYPSYSEGLPNAVIEAMSCALPIVASRAGGLPDLIADGTNGLLVPPGHPADLADALEKLADRPETRVSMQQSSYQIAHQRYDMERHVEALVDIYRSTITETPR